MAQAPPMTGLIDAGVLDAPQPPRARLPLGARLAQLRGRLRAGLAATLEAERERWPLWLPVALGAGSGFYFLLPQEPWPWAGPLLALLLLGLALRQRLRGELAGAWTMGLLAACALGFAAAGLRTASMPPPLDPPRRAVVLEGRVAQLDRLPDGRRLVLAEARAVGGAGAEDAGAAPWPRTVRVRLRAGDAAQPAPGDRVRVRALIRPPMAPAMPGAFDFQRQAFFQGLGASGFALGPAEIVRPAAEEGGTERRIAALRHRVVERIRDAMPAREAAVAAALLTGLVSSIPAGDLAAMRDSGLAHLLAVSGLHISIVCGLFLLGLRLLLAAIEPVALRWPIKKWAAVGALGAAYLYMLLTGANVPVQRAFAMAAIVLAGVLFDRRASPMRLLAWAAAAILLVQPEAVLGASFQMSFGAVVALIAAWEVLRRVLIARAEAGRPQRLAIKAAGLLATSLVASTATLPFAIYHFDRVAAYSVLANAVAVPLTTAWVMPWGVAGVLLMPFGLEAVALAPMGWGIDAILGTAHAVAALPGAAFSVPAMPAWGLVLAVLGGLWLCVWQRRWRLLGLPLLAAGLASAALVRPPALLVSDDARLIAWRAEGTLYLWAQPGANRLVREAWVRRLGARRVVAVPSGGRGDWAEGPVRCGGGVCALAGRGAVQEGGSAATPWALVVPAGGPVAAQCGRAPLLVSPEPLRGRCTESASIDRFTVWRQGAQAVWAGPQGPRVVADRLVRGRRPWVPPEPPQRWRDD